MPAIKDFIDVGLLKDRSLKLPQAVSNKNHSPVLKHAQGGFIKNGKWAWYVFNGPKEMRLRVVALDDGQTVSHFNFAGWNGYEDCYIKCIEEIRVKNYQSPFLAVCMATNTNSIIHDTTVIAIFSLENSSVLAGIMVPFHVSCARFLPPENCLRSVFEQFDGCLVIGTAEGNVIILNLKIQDLLRRQRERQSRNVEVFTPVNILDYDLDLSKMYRNFLECENDGVYCGIQLQTIDTPSEVCTILPIGLILGIAIGFEDGRLALYDLLDSQIFHISTPKEWQESLIAPIVQMDYMEPSDDPHVCLYICVVHENNTDLEAVLHVCMYDKRCTENDGFSYFENFRNSSVCLRFTLEATKGFTLCCQSVAQQFIQFEEDPMALFFISWYVENEEKCKLLILDLNQWYKEEMPNAISSTTKPNYIAGFILNEMQMQYPLECFIDGKSIVPFFSLQRFDEHFYPNSLSFRSAMLVPDGCSRHYFEGVQNRVINMLRASDATLYLSPDVYFKEILRTHLTPLFFNANLCGTFSKEDKYETIFAVALEHNCYKLLRSCAKYWADGSFLCDNESFTGLSLSSLTSWVLKHAAIIKSRFNEVCRRLFDYGGYCVLEHRERKVLRIITQHMSLLANLLNDIILYSKNIVSETVYDELCSKQTSLHIAYEYQHVLLWLYDVGLLPQAEPSGSRLNTNRRLVPYPFIKIRDKYVKRRSEFANINPNLISKKTGHCRLLYIDEFIQRNCNGSALREYWLEHNNTGLYPPASIECMVKVLLLTDVDFMKKCTLLFYFILDLNEALAEDTHRPIVSNFMEFCNFLTLPKSFEKVVYAFWYLDHGMFDKAITEFITPFYKDKTSTIWQVELFIEALLLQEKPILAMRILETRILSISPLLRLRTLLANALYLDAFDVARSNGKDMLTEFFTRCLDASNLKVLCDLVLNEEEQKLLQDIMKKSNKEGSQNKLFVYLLQKNKYLEAHSYMEELSSGLHLHPSSSNQLDTPNLVLSAYNSTMSPLMQRLTDVYFRIKGNINEKEANNQSPVPLSCQLVRQNANNLLGGIYHISALSAHHATYYWDKKEQPTANEVLSCSNAPFLRKPHPQINSYSSANKLPLSYPKPYVIVKKRSHSHVKNTDVDTDEKECPRKRRRLVNESSVTELSQFVKSHIQGDRLVATKEFSFNEDQENLLTQPLPQTPRKINESRPAELQSILKTSTPDCATRTCRKELQLGEHRNLRFELPNSADKVVNNTVEDNTIPHQEQILPTPSFDDDNSPDIDKTETKVREEVMFDTHKVKSVVIARTLSEESEQIEPAEDDQYTTPHSSINTSAQLKLIYETDISGIETSPIDDTDKNIPSGAQPRKSLATVSTGIWPIAEYPTNVAASITETLDVEDDRGGQLLSDNSAGDREADTCNTFKITDVISFESNIKEFVPQSYSTKVCETESTFSTQKTDAEKIADYSTVVGSPSCTYMETITERRNLDLSKPGKLLSSQSINNMLDTTLDMSSYEVTALEVAEQPHSVEKDTIKDANFECVDEVHEEPIMKEFIYECGSEEDTNSSVIIIGESETKLEQTDTAMLKENENIDDDNSSVEENKAESDVLLDENNEEPDEEERDYEDSRSTIPNNTTTEVVEISSNSSNQTVLSTVNSNSVEALDTILEESERSEITTDTTASSADEVVNKSKTDAAMQKKDEVKVQQTMLTISVNEKNSPNFKMTIPIPNNDGSDIKKKDDEREGNMTKKFEMSPDKSQTQNIESVTNSEDPKSVEAIAPQSSGIVTRQRKKSMNLGIDVELKSMLSPTPSRAHRSTSVPPQTNTKNDEILVPFNKSIRRGQRGISVPPQVAEEHSENVTMSMRSTTSTLRSDEGKSPPYKSSRNQKSLSSSISAGTTRKLSSRKMMESPPNIMDTPSSRTRSRLRRMSRDSEADSSESEQLKSNDTNSNTRKSSTARKNLLPDNNDLVGKSKTKADPANATISHLTQRHIAQHERMSSPNVNEQVSSPTPYFLRGRNSRSSQASDNEDGEIATSTRRTNRSATKSKKDNDDIYSVASSSASSGKPPKRPVNESKLNAIPESDEVS